jgi:hypothetical protein
LVYQPFQDQISYPRALLEFWLAKLFHRQPKLAKSKEIVLTEQELERVAYYMKIKEAFRLSQSTSLLDLPFSGLSRYKADLAVLMSSFPLQTRFRAKLGDVRKVQPEPTLTKSRPLATDNEKNILLPLDTARHFRFVNDPVSFENKKPALVWRGAVYKEPRITFLNATRKLEFCDVGPVAQREDLGFALRPRMSIREQLNYRFIFSIEGNDVATNLKWVMSSNSLCFMPRPSCETWFMEGLLEPGKHYVELKPDFSDVETKFLYYRDRADLCQEIIKNAQSYVARFLDIDREFAIAREVIKQYSILSRQIL